MTETSMTMMGDTGSHRVSRIVTKMIALCERIPYSLLALAARIFPAAVFWQSGETKVEGWHVTDTAITLFREEYNLPLIDPVIAAHLSAFAEHVFPVLLVFGLASRFAALALLGMTLVIEIFVYPYAWPTHGTWAACFLLIIARGPGMIAFDHLIQIYVRPRCQASQ
ncbi:DoxX family protein [Beijerinckia indica]|uniref:DoxX family protein n=1 Tax=Beijerinckia indica subsp. indica (strain ATCC 9039 / DSM 1715 / NCIMB 8712) TaxID=395963 RepID=B2IC92_BEII9|nr:DoxX family protein [Beijerinckia indica subsp. indica ATCC 9039]